MACHIRYSCGWPGALVPVSNATSSASGSIVSDTQLISKVNSPRLAVPLAAVQANFVDLSIGMLREVVLLTVFGVPLSRELLAIPLVVGLLVLAALCVSVWLSALDVQYRDPRCAASF
jgi:ABC-type polysaccharide/polyol phosphate export permease